MHLVSTPLSKNLLPLSSSQQVPPKTYGSSNNLESSKVSNALWWTEFIALLNVVSLDTLVYMLIFMLIAFYTYKFIVS